MEDNKISQKLDEADDLSRQGKLSEATALLEALYAAHPDEDSVLLRLAWLFWDQGDKERSIACWETLLDRELQRKVFTGFAYDELVRIYKQDGRIDKLVDTCEKAVRVQPDDVGLLEELGKAYLLSGQNEKARTTFEQLTSMEPDHAVFHCRLGEALVATGQYEAGERAYQHAAATDPGEADRFFLQAADLYLKAGRPDSAQTLIEKCLIIAPSNSLYYCFLGDILVALKKPEDAFVQYEKAGLYNPPHKAAYFNRLGNALMKVGLSANAVKAYETALSLDATTPCRSNLDEARRSAGL